jgi:ATP/maltotriose-dependent transcriptional regulator MalT
MVTFDLLVGRADELGSVDLALAELDRGEPAALALVGEPGIGKTRMLTELASRADERGYLVLSGSGSELEGDVPFWVFVDALDEYLRGLDPALLGSLDDEVRAELAQVFPAIPAHGSAGTGLQNERYRTHRAVRALLEGLAGTKPLVLVLDDFHWADSGSAELLGALLHRPPAAPVLVALAMRPRLVPERLSVALERAHRAGTLTRVELEALSSEEARELFDGDGANAAALYEESGGNPFYLEQLVRGLRREGPSTSSPSETITLAEVQVPPTVVAALAQELGALTEGARLVIQGASVAGDPFEPELAAAAAATSETGAMDALDELLAVDLVRPTDVPRRFRFRHPLVRRAVYESTPGGWRLGAHERTATALAERGAPVAARAHHVELSARPGDAAAVAVLRQAGEESAQRAPATAARWFDSALRLVSENVPPEERVELLLARAGSLTATGHYADSHAALLGSLALVPADAVALRVRLVAACASVEHLLSLFPQARARLESALDELEDPDSPEAAALMIELAAAGMYRGDFEAMTSWAERAVTAAGKLEDRALTAAALSVRACGAALSGTAAEAQAQCEEAAQVVDRLTDDELARRLDAVVHLVSAEGYLDRFEPSTRHGQRAMTIGRATGQGDLFPLLYAMFGTGLWVQGRVAESVELLDGAVEGARLVDSNLSLAWILLNRAMAALAEGDLEVARASAEESTELASRLEADVVSSWSAVALATVLLETGEASRGADMIVASAGGEEIRMVGGGWRARCLELLTRCYLASGRRAQAERSAEAAANCAKEVQLPMAAAMAGLAAAALDLDRGDSASAAKGALDAATVLEDVGDVLDATRARLLAGRALAQAGEQDAAAAELERARAAYDSFGSTRHRAEAERELRKLGKHIHRRTAHGTGDGGLASLTERELELARLVADRKTNPQIAAELFLSPKTVETHLRNIFRKVGVANRVELARIIEQADRNETPAG